MSLEHSPARGRLRNTRQASDYLLEQHGVVRSVAYLNKLRVTGGGPTFHKVGTKQVAYDQASLDTYAAALISRPLRSTSEAAA
jgi:hypothetical protein